MKRTARARHVKDVYSPNRRTDAAFSDDETLAFLNGQWVQCRSSNVTAMRYLPDTETLEIEFHGGRGQSTFYGYPNISFDMAEGFARAPSKGGSVWDYLRNNRWPYHLLTGPSRDIPKAPLEGPDYPQNVEPYPEQPNVPDALPVGPEPTFNELVDAARGYLRFGLDAQETSANLQRVFSHVDAAKAEQAIAIAKREL